MLHSILDTDLYKFTMQQAILEHYPDARVTYKMYDRGGDCPTISKRNIIDAVEHLRLSNVEKTYLAGLGIFKPGYLDYLEHYKFKGNRLNQTSEGLYITGPWHETVLWEVPILAMHAEAHYRNNHGALYLDDYMAMTRRKFDVLEAGKCEWMEFGTRRRANPTLQYELVREASRYLNFLGTSNVDIARKAGVKPLGTMAHEWIMGVAGKEGVAGANPKALEKWIHTYHDKLMVALTDTHTTDSFFESVSGKMAWWYEGLRQDSGNPFEFVDKAIVWWRNHGIDPANRTIVFSDSLDVGSCIQLAAYCEQRGVGYKFGIGTHMTHDFSTRPNIVMKLHSIDGVEVSKLSDDAGKETGHPNVVKRTKEALCLS